MNYNLFENIILIKDERIFSAFKRVLFMVACTVLTFLGYLYPIWYIMVDTNKVDIFNWIFWLIVVLHLVIVSGILHIIYKDEKKCFMRLSAYIDKKKYKELSFIMYRYKMIASELNTDAPAVLLLLPLIGSILAVWGNCFTLDIQEVKEIIAIWTIINATMIYAGVVNPNLRFYNKLIIKIEEIKSKEVGL